MAGRYHFDNPARREWWSVHVEACQRSGLSQRRYCRAHKLTAKTFARWIGVLTDAKSAKILVERAAAQQRAKRNRKGGKLSTDRRNRVVQAYWAMHVEALEWSGMTVREYAGALAISQHSLRRWRDLLAEMENPVDWRARLHPSARPTMRSVVSPRTSSDLSPGFLPGSTRLELTNDALREPEQTDRTQRRSLSDDEKRAIVMQTLDPHVTVSQIARRHGIAAAMLFRWRARYGPGGRKQARLVTVQVREAVQ